jgi:hypothetical protein
VYGRKEVLLARMLCVHLVDDDEVNVTSSGACAVCCFVHHVFGGITNCREKHMSANYVIERVYVSAAVVEEIWMTKSYGNYFETQP